MTDTLFQGFAEPQENWSRLPHVLINALPIFETKAELSVVLYILRHTWGYGDEEKKITLDEFMNGRKRKDGTRIDSGTGMVKQSIINGLQRAEQHGFIEVEVDDSDKARIEKFYSLRMSKNHTSDVQSLDIGGLKVRQRSEKETSERNKKKKTSKSAKAEDTVLKWYITDDNTTIQRQPPSSDEFMSLRGPFDTESLAHKALSPELKFGFKQAVMHVWGLQPLPNGKNGLEVNYMGLLSGKGKKGSQWEAHHLEDPATTEEVIGFGGWYSERYGDATLPAKAESIHNNFMLFRQSSDYQEWMAWADEQVRGLTNALNFQTAEPEEPETGSDSVYDQPIGDNPKFAGLLKKLSESRDSILRDES
jgi:DNA-binding PadR family transcriptional regulator